MPPQKRIGRVRTYQRARGGMLAGGVVRCFRGACDGPASDMLGCNGRSQGGSPVADSLDFDLVAARLRADAQDLGTFMEVLARKLEEALPGAAEVRRAGGLFRRDHPVNEIRVVLGEWNFHLRAAPAGVAAERAHTVRGVALKSEELPLDAWLAALLEALRQYAQSNSTAAQSLERLLT